MSKGNSKQLKGWPPETFPIFKTTKANLISAILTISCKLATEFSISKPITYFHNHYGHRLGFLVKNLEIPLFYMGIPWNLMEIWRKLWDCQILQGNSKFMRRIDSVIAKFFVRPTRIAKERCIFKMASHVRSQKQLDRKLTKWHSTNDITYV